MQNKAYSCRIGEKRIEMHEPIVMGIINITDNSFYQQGNLTYGLDLAQRHLQEGAHLLDIGVCSTRPGAQLMSEEEEIQKLIPCLLAFRKAFPDCIFSVDTFRGNVVAEAYKAIGPFIVNDVSGGKWDPSIWKQVALHSLPYILTYSQGSPKTMQTECVQTPILDEMLAYFAQTISEVEKMGIKEIWIDPGFGFGKTLDQNYEILSNLRIFEVFSRPILIGLSRKSMIYNALHTTPEQALVGTSIAHHIALTQGASIFRVHDVAAMRDTICITDLSQKHTHA